MLNVGAKKRKRLLRRAEGEELAEEAAILDSDAQLVEEVAVLDSDAETRRRKERQARELELACIALQRSAGIRAPDLDLLPALTPEEAREWVPAGADRAASCPRPFCFRRCSQRRSGPGFTRFPSKISLFELSAELRLPRFVVWTASIPVVKDLRTCIFMICFAKRPWGNPKSM